MLCCVGIMGGVVVGQALGGPWTLIAPAAGFGIGLVADMRIMKGMHQKAGAQQAETGLRARADADPKAPNQGAAPASAAESGACCGVASGLVRMLGGEEKKEQAQPRATESVTTAQPVVVEKAKSA